MYTFEDWLKDKFDENSVIVNEFSTDGILINTIRQPRNYLRILLCDGQIDISTYIKIREAQEDVFDKALEMTVMSFEMEINPVFSYFRGYYYIKRSAEQGFIISFVISCSSYI